MPTLPKTLTRALHLILLSASAVLLFLHTRHLQADFPNNSPWMDWSKYTDEGWYGDAAIRHFQLGQWYVPGDFNPAAALPVWPLLEGLVFHFTGVSLSAARALTVAVFGGILIASWLLVAGTRRSRQTPPQLQSTSALAASASVFLLAASPFCFVFTRMAILEPLLVLLTLLALLAARTARPDAQPPGAWTPQTAATIRRNLFPIVALGLLLPLLILTKTTSLFIFPAIAWMLFACAGYRLWTFLRIALPTAALAVTLWLLYFFALVRPHFLLDYRYLFSANAYTGITFKTMFQVLSDTVTDGMWMGSILYPCALAAVLFVLSRRGRLRPHPLLAALLLWAGGYAFFLAYHNNLQPRYYLVIAVPLTLLVPAVLGHLVLPLFRSKGPFALALIACAALVLTIALPDARQTVHFVRHPDYTLVHAAAQVHDFIAQDLQRDPAHSPLVLSISGSDLSLMTGLHSIDDDFGTLELPDRVKRYHPGWYAAWNQLDDDKMDAMTPLYRVVRVAAFPAMDDPDRNLLILYRLDPAVPTPLHLRPGQPVPRRLRTEMGQQPSTTQLEH